MPSIRNVFENDMISYRLFSDTGWHAVFICIEIIRAFSIIWNVLALGVLLQDKFRKRAINMCLACLCVGFLIDTGIKLSVDLISFLCPAVEIILTAIQTLIAMLVTAITFERYVAIVHPFSRLVDIRPKTILKVGVLNVKTPSYQRMNSYHEDRMAIHTPEKQVFFLKRGSHE